VWTSFLTIQRHFIFITLCALVCQALRSYDGEHAVVGKARGPSIATSLSSNGEQIIEASMSSHMHVFLLSLRLQVICSLTKLVKRKDMNGNEVRLYAAGATCMC
jgi:hypothetical protein